MAKPLNNIVTHTYAPKTTSHMSNREHINICTFNIAHGRGLSAHQLFLREKIIKAHLRRIATFLQTAEIHIAALQEVDIESFWNGNFEHARFLSKYLPGLVHSAVGEHMSYRKLRYGTGILATLPHKISFSRTFQSSQALPRKGFVLSEFCWPEDQNFTFDVVSLHLDFLSRRQRERQLAQLCDELRSRTNPMILMGDMNSQWHDKKSAVRSLMRTLHLHTYDPENLTLPTFRRPRRRWDWILVSDTFQFVDYRHGPDDLSDHVPVLARITRND